MVEKIYKRSIETRKKLSELAKKRIGVKNPFFGKKHSIETRKKLSEINKCKKHSEETRKKLRIARIGKKPFLGHRHSEKTKKIQSEALKGSKCYRWKGGYSKTDSGYILVYLPEHPFKNYAGYVREHRIIAEKCLGRYLTKKETIHHINEIIDDNRPENLYLFSTREKHRKYHINPYKLTSNLASTRPL